MKIAISKNVLLYILFGERTGNAKFTALDNEKIVIRVISKNSNHGENIAFHEKKNAIHSMIG